MEFLRLRLKLIWTACPVFSGKPGACLWAFMFLYLGDFDVFGVGNLDFVGIWPPGGYQHMDMGMVIECLPPSMEYRQASAVHP
ncbi:hypothetical protein [Lunatibacter salilacus]